MDTISFTLNRALRDVRHREGALTFICRTFVNDRERQDSIRDIANKYRDEIMAKHHAACAEHAKRLQVCESKLAHLRSRLDGISNDGPDGLDQFLATARGAIPTTKKEVKVLRAIERGLVLQTREQLERPAQNDSAYDELKRVIKRQDEYKCVCCGSDGSSNGLHVHHVIPLYKFGTNDAVNLVTVCLACHRKIHRREGITVTGTRSTIRRPRHDSPRFIAADIETTGLSNDDEIIEIGAALFEDGVCKETFQTFVQISRPLPTFITQLTGITSAMLRNAPSPQDALSSFLKFSGSDTLVFHNASFDKRFLSRYADMFDLPFENEVRCTLKLAREKLPKLQNHKLLTLVEHFRLRVSPSHRATDDSIATGLALIELSRIRTPSASH